MAIAKRMNADTSVIQHEIDHHKHQEYVPKYDTENKVGEDNLTLNPDIVST